MGSWCLVGVELQPRTMKRFLWMDNEDGCTIYYEWT